MSGSQPEVSAETLRSIPTPDSVGSRLSTLKLDDGAPCEATAVMLYDHVGWWTTLRFCNRLRSFFITTWRPGEIEPI